MANRRPLTLNPGGYQEYFQSGDTLQVDGSISINGASFTSVVPLTITGPGESNLGAAAIVGTFKADEITVDANTGDTVVITLGSDGNISASGRVEATSIDINSSTVIDGVLDEDTLVSDSETKLATQQSIKAYVDAITKTVRFAADTGSGSIEAGDNVTDTITIAGTVNEIETSVSGDTITLTLASTIVLDVVQVNSLQINGSTTVDGILDEDDFASDSATKLATQQSIKAFSENYTDTQIAAIPNATQSVRGFQSPADKTKLDNIEAGATADQTGAEIKALYEVEPNAYTDTKDTKLAGIEAGATADQTAAEIRALVDSASDSNVFTDADHTKLDGIEDSATADQTGAEIKALYEQEPSAFTDAQFTKLAGIEDAATADQTGAEIKALYEAEPSAFTDAQFTKLAGIEAGATADQTDAEIRAAVEAATDSNVFTDADHTKLDAIEAGAEVNVPHDLSYTASTRALDITNGTGTTLPEATTTEAGLQSAADKTKLDGIEAGATADQTAAEIRSLVDSANDSNVFTDSDHTKLDGIEPGAEVNLAHDLSYTPSTREIAITNGTNITLPLATSGGNAGLLAGSDQTQLDSLTTNLAGKADLVGGKLSVSQVPDIAITEFLGNVTSQSDLTTLSGQKGDWATVSSQGIVYIITANDGSTASDWTALEYPASMANLSYNSATRTVISDGGTDAVLPEVVSGGISGLMTGAQASKLDGIEAAATADQTAAEIRTLVESATDSNVFTDADHTKLNAIEAGAEVNVPTDLTYDAATRTVESSTGANAVIPHVVSSGNSGLISGADKAKLDGIEAGATADQTKADIDALNIDADTLDGVQGSSFLRSDVDDSFNTVITGNTLHLGGSQIQNSGASLQVNGFMRTGNINLHQGGNNPTNTSLVLSNNVGSLEWDSNTVWHTGIDFDLAHNTSYATYDTVNQQSGFITWYALNDANVAGTAPDTGTYWSGIQSLLHDDSKYGWQLVGNAQSGVDPNLYIREISNNNYGDWYKVWSEMNDGSGSGLDADLLDGVQGSSFLRSDQDDTFNGVLTVQSNGNNTYGLIKGYPNDNHFIGMRVGVANQATLSISSVNKTSFVEYAQDNDSTGWYWLSSHIDYGEIMRLTRSAGLQVLGNEVWHAGNDGSGSGLDADTVDGIHGTQFLRRDRADTIDGQLTVKGDLLLSGDPTTTNQARTIDFTGFDKENTTDTSDRATIMHTVNVGGHSGSVLSISSQNDVNDGIAFLTNPDSQLKHNFNTIWTAGNHGAGSGLNADLLDGQQGSYYLAASAMTDHSLNPKFSTTIGFGNDTEIIRFNDSTNETRTDYWTNKDGFYIQGDGNLVDKVVLKSGNLDLTGAAYIAGRVGIGGDLYIPNKIIHEGDTDTYFQFEANDKARIVIAGGEVMEWGNNYALMNDNDFLRFGTGSDFRMHFNGSDMYFRNYSHANGDIIFQGEDSSGSNKNLLIMKTDGTRPYTIIYENNAERFRTTSAGVTITGALTATGDVTAFSDITLKKDIEVIPNALDKVAEIRGVTYERTDTEEPLRQAGVIAQEVEKVLPEVVHTNEDGIKSVAYGNLVSLLIESVKELKAQNEELKARVEKLENN